MPFIVCLENLPFTADSLDIRHFFFDLNVPSDGIRIVRERRRAFICFNTVWEAKEALRRDGGCIRGERVRLYQSNFLEYQQFGREAADHFHPSTSSSYPHSYAAHSTQLANTNFNVGYPEVMSLAPPVQPVSGQKKNKGKKWQMKQKRGNTFRRNTSIAVETPAHVQGKDNLQAKDKLGRAAGNKAKHKPFVNFCVELSGFPPKTTYMEVQKLLSGMFLPDRNMRWKRKDVTYGVDERTAYVQLSNKDDFEKIISKETLQFHDLQIPIKKCDDELFFTKFSRVYEKDEVKRFRNFIGEGSGLWWKTNGWAKNTQANDVKSFFSGLLIANFVILYYEKDLCYRVGFVEFSTSADHRRAYDHCNGKKSKYGCYIELLPTTLAQVTECKRVAPYVYELIKDKEVPQTASRCGIQQDKEVPQAASTCGIQQGGICWSCSDHIYNDQSY